MKSEFTIGPLSTDMLTDMYLTFLDSFSDYQISFKLSKKQFVDKFVRKLNIDFEYSAGAWNSTQGLEAFIFTSIAQYQGKLTAYNGGTGVRPKARSNNLVSKMYETILPKLQSLGVQQCLLEVLEKNERAIRAYRKVGFEEMGLLRCYKLHNPGHSNHQPHNIQFNYAKVPQKELYENFIDQRASFLDDLIMQRQFDQERIIEAYDQNKCIGFLIYQPKFSRINGIAVSPIYRRARVASGLIDLMIKNEGFKQVTVLNVPEESEALNSFLTRQGFLNEINQYEMRMNLSK
ncbi:MAG: GNAT family N-acetyltransferase [Bacteroidota bacterium]